MKSILLGIFTIFLALTSFAQQTNFSANTLSIGDSTSSTKQIKFKIQSGSTQPGIRYNGSSSKVEASNDGSTWNAIAFAPPTVQILTATSSQTYTTPAGVRYIVVEMIGGGGGGSGSGTSGSGGAGGAGGNTVFGSSLLTAGGGAGGLRSTNGGLGGSGGTNTINSPAITIKNFSGGGGGSSSQVGSASDNGSNRNSGGNGGAGMFGGGGIGGNGAPTSIAGLAAGTYGGGGGGAGKYESDSSGSSGSGGGAGGGVVAQINSPGATYSYQCGAGGSAGSAGTNGAVGSVGNQGVIIVTEYY